MSSPKGIYKEGIWGKFIYYAVRLRKMLTTLLNEHPVSAFFLLILTGMEPDLWLILNQHWRVFFLKIWRGEANSFYNRGDRRIWNRELKGEPSSMKTLTFRANFIIWYLIFISMFFKIILGYLFVQKYDIHGFFNRCQLLLDNVVSSSQNFSFGIHSLTF